MADDDTHVDQDGNIWEKNWAGQYEQKWDMWNQRPAHDDRERENQADANSWDGSTPLYSTRNTDSSSSSSGSSDAGAAIGAGLFALVFLGVGALISAFRRPNATIVSSAQSGQSPSLAAILSGFITGMGQMYLGQRKKGIVYLLLGFLSFAVGLGFLVSALSALDAYGAGYKLKAGHTLQEWEFSFQEGLQNIKPISWIVIGVVTLFVIVVLANGGKF